MTQTKVQIDVDASGLEQAMSRFEKFSGSMSSAQRVMGQFGRFGEEAVRGAGALTPEQYEKMGRALDNMKRMETDITKQVQDRRTALAAIDTQMEKIFSKKSPAMDVYERMIARGFTPEGALRRALAHDLPGGGELAGLRTLEPQARRLHDEIAELEKERARVGGGIPAAQAAYDQIGQKFNEGLDRVFSRWMPQLIRATLAIGGLGTATAIAAESRSRTLQFNLRAADIAGYIGQRSAIRGAGLAAGDYGAFPLDRLDIIESLGAAGGVLNPQSVNRMAGMGLYFGLGRPGFAQMARQGVATGRFADFAQFGRFGATAGGLSESYGLNPAQRTFFLESNKNLIEQMTRWYGGRPLNVEDYFGGVNTLMTSMRGLNLPAGGFAVAQEVMQNFAQSMTPIGRPFGDLVTQATLLGLRPIPGEGLYFGHQRQMIDMLRKPDAFLRSVQGLAGTLDIPTGPGANIDEGQLDALAAVMSRKFPGMLAAMGQLNSVGVNPRDVLQMQDQGLPAETADKMQKALDDVRGAVEDSWRRAEIERTVQEITGIGKGVVAVETFLKQHVGPGTTASLSLVGSAISVLGPGLASYIGAKTALGAAGGAGAGLGAAASRFLGPAALLALPFTLSGEGMGTEPPKSNWRGPPPTKEQFIELQEMARRGQIPELSGPLARGGRPSPLAQETLVDALLKAFYDLMVKVGELATATEEETRSRRAQSVLPERRSYQPVRGGGPRR